MRAHAGTHTLREIGNYILLLKQDHVLQKKQQENNMKIKNMIAIFAK